MIETRVSETVDRIRNPLGKWFRFGGVPINEPSALDPSLQMNTLIIQTELTRLNLPTDKVTQSMSHPPSPLIYAKHHRPHICLFKNNQQQKNWSTCLNLPTDESSPSPLIYAKHHRPHICLFKNNFKKTDRLVWTCPLMSHPHPR